jgi:hypothetical protein
MTIMMMPVSLLFSRLTNVLEYHSFAPVRLVSDSASSGFRGSSRMIPVRGRIAGDRGIELKIGRVSRTGLEV